MSDILLDSLTGDLKIVGGDFVVGDSMAQEVWDILVSVPGFYKQFPFLGCALEQYQNGSIKGLDTIIRKQLLSDGFIIDDLKITLSPIGALKVVPAVHR